MIHFLDPFITASVCQVGIQRIVQLLSVLQSRRFITIGRHLYQDIGLDHRAQTLPHELSGTGDINKPVGCLEHAGRCARGVIISSL